MGYFQRMGRLTDFIFVFTLLAFPGYGQYPSSGMLGKDEPINLVNLFLGTGGHGHTHPAAMLPFGMIQAGPDTRLSGWDGCSGYHYNDDTIYGFSQTHLSGTGVSDYGDVLLMPFSGPVRDSITELYPFAAPFSHEKEAARPGFYRVELENGIQVEICASARAALYRIIYPAGAAPKLWIDLDHRDEVSEASLIQTDVNAISGYRISNNWANEQYVYFHLIADHPVASLQRFGNRTAVMFGAFGDADVKWGAKSKGNKRQKPQKQQSVRTANSSQDTLLLKIGISAVDEAGAHNNVESEIPDFNWNKLSEKTEANWREELSRITVAGGTKAQRATFFTAIYHALCAPNLYMDQDLRYRGMDHRIHIPVGFTPYTVFSLWDTYRAAHPLYTLAWPEKNQDFIRTMLDDFKKSGRLPVWKLADYETNCMIGYHSVPVIADAWSKGQRDFDAALAMQAMVASAERTARGLQAYRKFGFIPADTEAESVSQTLEYAYDDACIARMAADLARESEKGLRAESALPDGRSYAALADTFARRAASWKHLFDPETGFFRARQNGGFISPFDPAEVNFHYTEANAWQYAFSAPQDLMGHAEMLAAATGQPAAFREALAEKLDGLFAALPVTTGREQVDISGLIGQYAHGNEPSHHIAYLYAHLGQPWKTQQRVRQILTELHSDRPDGLCGNEDCGQMSAWYVLSAAGFYPLAPGLPEYTLGSPLFDTVTFRLPDNKTFRLIARRNGPDRPYVSSAMLNGIPYDSVTLRHATVARGGTLVLTMSSDPFKEWGVSDALASDLTDGSSILAAPFAEPAPRTFTDSLKIVLRCADPLVLNTAAQLANPLQDVNPAERFFIQWRFGGESGWREYTTPIAITGNASLEFRSAGVKKNAVGEMEKLYSPVQESRFTKSGGMGSLKLGTAYAPQYAAGGDQALIDGLRGPADFRTGFWQGYQGVDLEATLDLGQVREIKAVVAGFLQDENSWIFYPLRVELEISVDGQNWRTLAADHAPVPWHEPGVLRHDFRAGVSTPVRYIRLRGVNRGICPPEHKAAGHKSWIFSDEFFVE